MKEAPLLKKFSAWFLQKKAEVEKMINPKIIDETMWQGDTYRLKNGQEVKLELGTVNDVEVIMEIQEACYGGRAPWGRLIVYNELQNRLAFFLIVKRYSEGLAFIAFSIRNDSLHVTNVGTKPDYQKQGLASFLFEKAIALAQELELKQITLEVRISNTSARRLYQKIGFQDRYLKKNYYSDNKEDALEMVLPLKMVESE